MIRSLLRKIYKEYCPLTIRKRLLLIESDYHIKLKYDILDFYKKNENLDIETTEVLDYIKQNKYLQVFPYDFTKNYNVSEIEVFTDKSNGFPYVIHDQKKLYFKKHWDQYKVKHYYSTLLFEQDIKSPHRYLTNSFNVSMDDTVVDAGVAEGNFSLEIIDKAQHIYMYEPDVEWVEALKLTFAPWKHKITIHKKFVSNINNENNITLDASLNNKEINFLKADIEGFEQLMLKGSIELLQTNKIKNMVICTYHNNDDYENTEKLLSKYGYTTSPSNGYMLLYYDSNIKPPYFRKALIRSSAKN